MLGFVLADPDTIAITICKGEKVRSCVLLMCGGTERWPPSLWPDKREEGAPATADGGVSLPLLEPGPHRLGVGAC